MPLRIDINKPSHRLFVTMIQIVVALIVGWLSLRQWRLELMDTRPTRFTSYKGDQIPQSFIDDLEKLMPLTTILAAFTSVAGACFVRFCFGHSRFNSKLGFIALSWPLLYLPSMALTSLLFLIINISAVKDFAVPLMALLLIVVIPINFLPIGPIIAVIAAHQSARRKQQLLDVVAVPVAGIWWLLLSYLQLYLIIMEYHSIY